MTTVYALGNFDGLHVGHQALLSSHVAWAGQLGAVPGVATFTPHPRLFFRPDAEPFLLTTAETQAVLMHALGIATISPIPFTEVLASMTPADFVQLVLLGYLKAKGVTVGADFCFGKDRAGTAQTLVELGAHHGLVVNIVAPVGDGEKYASSRIRTALQAGDVAEANRQLNRPWAITGIVQHGDARGRTIGFPTANLTLGNLIRPRFGVYAATAHTADGHYPAAVNIGQRPTVDGTDDRVEAHLIGFDGDLYGQPLHLDLHAFIRPEQKFDGLAALKAQIDRDVETTLRLLTDTI